jgi:enoyl-CoA hydratase/carnithine racemase
MKLEGEGRLAWLTFTRETSLNAINNDGTIEINQMAQELYDRPDIRVVIIRGEGRAFSTGIDLKEFAADKIEMAYHQRWEHALRLFETMEKIVIIGMHGYCLGGALQLALACDIRVSTPNCQIGLPAIKESLIPGLSTWRLARYIGLGRAKRMILGGENLSGEEGMKIGLVDHLVPEKDFQSHLDGLAEEYLRVCSFGSRMSKLLINRSFETDYDSMLNDYMDLQEKTQLSSDTEEAKRAYLGSREPHWQ